MASLLPTLLVVALLAAPVLSATRMIFSGNITCKLDLQFAYYIVVHEMDFANHDIIYTGGTKGYQYHTSSYNLSFVDNYDGPSNKFFEIAFQVVHDCNSKTPRKSLSHRFDVAQIPISDGTEYHSLDFDITDLGTKFFAPVEKGFEFDQ